MKLSTRRPALAAAFICFGAPAVAQSTVPVVTPAIGQGGYITSIAFSPDGKWIASGGQYSVAVWDIASGAVLRKFVAGFVSSIAVSPDGQLVASVGDNKVNVWNVSNGRMHREVAGDLKDAVAFSTDGRWLATTRYTLASPPQVVLFDARSGAEVKSLSAYERGKEAFGIGSIAFSGDGGLLASGGNDKTVRLWHPASGRLLRTLSHPASVKTVAISGDGRLVASGGEKEKSVRVWDTASGTLQWTLQGHPDEITSIAFSPDGNRVVTGSNSSIKLWNAASGILQWSVDDKSNFTAQKFSPDGRLIASGALNQTIILLDVSDGRVVRKLDQRAETLHPVIFSPEGSWLASGGVRLRRWDTASGRELGTFGNSIERPVGLAVARDSRTLVAGKALVDVANGRLVKTMDGLAPYPLGNALTFSGDGRWFASAEAKSVRMWAASDGRLIRTIAAHSDAAKAVATSPDGRTIASISSSEAKLWDAATGRALRTLVSEHRCRLGTAITRCGLGNNALAFSPDGRSLAVAGGVIGFHFAGKHGTLGWGLIRLWDVASGRLLRVIDDSPHDLHAIAFSPDGKAIATASDSSAVSVWDAASGRQSRSLYGHSTVVKSLAFSPDGRRIAGGSESEIMLWSAESGEVIATIVASTGGERAVITAEGFFDASKDGAKLLYVVRGFDVTAIDQAYQALFNPDLVREKLSDDTDGEVKRAAGVLDLAKVLDSGLAPDVELVAGAGDRQSPDEIVTAKARITDRGGGIGRIEWRLNGVTVSVAHTAPGSSKERIVSQSLALEPGENTIEMVAYNGRSLLSSLPASTTVTWAAPADQPRPKLHVIAVGINDYKDAVFRPLRHAVADARAFGAAMKAAGSDLYADVEVTSVLDADATIDNLEKVIGDAGRRMHQRDTFIFLAAAHGKAEGGRFHLIPQDYRNDAPGTLAEKAIGQDRLQAWFANRIKARRGLILLDTCESGALVASRPSGVDAGNSEAALGRLNEATGRPVLTAAAADQAAVEGYKGHGVFTYALLDALVNGDTNNNGQIELSELATHIQTLAPKLSQELRERGGQATASAPNSRAAVALGGASIVPRLADFKQKPRMGSRGEDFPLAKRLSVLPAQ